jgi:hypothetical protein
MVGSQPSRAAIVKQTKQLAGFPWKLSGQIVDSEKKIANRRIPAPSAQAIAPPAKLTVASCWASSIRSSIFARSNLACSDCKIRSVLTYFLREKACFLKKFRRGLNSPRRIAAVPDRSLPPAPSWSAHPFTNFLRPQPIAPHFDSPGIGRNS